VIEARTILTSDGIALEAELVTPTDAPLRAAVVLCHPHPQYGGTMRSIVISALFEALPHAGIACLRFNFRGVEASAGTHDEGRAEQLDVLAAIDALSVALPEPPLLLTGWSFGADMALSTIDDRITGWFAIAPPLRFASDFSVVANDARPKLLALAEHDEFRPPESVLEEVAPWTATHAEIVPGASHFFVGRTDRLVELALGYVSSVGSTG
jgi:alpha/beta superfamily hydrolase